MKQCHKKLSTNINAYFFAMVEFHYLLNAIELNLGRYILNMFEKNNINN